MGLVVKCSKPGRQGRIGRFAGPGRSAWVAAASVVVVALAGCGGGDEEDKGDGPAAGGPPGPPPSKVRVGLVQRDPVQQKRLIIGTIEPAQRSLVAAEEAGRVVEAPPDRGTTVASGDLLARLDDVLLQRQRAVEEALKAQARASANEARARYEQASKLVDRYRDLVGDGGITQTQLDEAVRDMRVAEAQQATAAAEIERHDAAIALIDERIERMEVFAPFAGEIIEKHAEVGQWLPSGGEVVSLVRIDKVDAVLNVPDHMIGQIDAETPIELLVTSNGQRRAAPVYRIVREADRRGRTFPVVVRIDNDDGAIRPGMMVEAELPTGRRIESLTVPRDAVHTTPSGIRVMVNRGGEAVPVPVSLRFKVGDRFAVDATLQPGEQVVVEGNERLMPGAPLDVLNREEVAGQGAPPDRPSPGGAPAPSTDDPAAPTG